MNVKPYDLLLKKVNPGETWIYLSCSALHKKLFD